MDENKIMEGIDQILKKVEEVGNRIDGLEERMGSLEERMDGLEGRMDRGFKEVNERLDRLENGVDLLAHKQWKNEQDIYYLKQQFEKVIKEGA